MLQLELKLGTEKNGKRLLIGSTNDMKNFAKSCFVKAMEGRKVKATKEQAAEWFETIHPPGPAAREMYRMAAEALRAQSVVEQSLSPRESFSNDDEYIAYLIGVIRNLETARGNLRALVAELEEADGSI